LGDERRDSIFAKARPVCRGRVVRSVPIGDRCVSASLVGIPITIVITGLRPVILPSENARTATPVHYIVRTRLCVRFVDQNQRGHGRTLTALPSVSRVACHTGFTITKTIGVSTRNRNLPFVMSASNLCSDIGTKQSLAFQAVTVFRVVRN